MAIRKYVSEKKAERDVIKIKKTCFKVNQLF